MTEQTDGVETSTPHLPTSPEDRAADHVGDHQQPPTAVDPTPDLTAATVAEVPAGRV